MKTIRIGLIVALGAALIAPMPARGDNIVVEQEERPEVPAADQASDEAAPPPRVVQPEVGGVPDVEAPPPVEQPPVDQ